MTLKSTRGPNEGRDDLLPAAQDSAFQLPDEVYGVDLKSWRFRRAYLAGCLKYPFHFFRAAPITHWHKVFLSTHRVACSCAVAACALENSVNMWDKNSLRSRLRAWAKSRRWLAFTTASGVSTPQQNTDPPTP